VVGGGRARGPGRTSPWSREDEVAIPVNDSVDGCPRGRAAMRGRAPSGENALVRRYRVDVVTDRVGGCPRQSSKPSGEDALAVLERRFRDLWTTWRWLPLTSA
jgi:hypothetical protein